MAQGGKIFDDLGRLMNDAAGVADGVRREIETAIRSQMERVTADMDLVKREDFEALRELVRNQTDDIERLKAEIETLKSGGKSS
jgi:BMFP domain-containing protein YqiC